MILEQGLQDNLINMQMFIYDLDVTLQKLLNLPLGTKIELPSQMADNRIINENIFHKIQNTMQKIGFINYEIPQNTKLLFQLGKELSEALKPYNTTVSTPFFEVPVNMDHWNSIENTCIQMHYHLMYIEESGISDLKDKNLWIQMNAFIQRIRLSKDNPPSPELVIEIKIVGYELIKTDGIYKIRLRHFGIY